MLFRHLMAVELQGELRHLHEVGVRQGDVRRRALRRVYGRKLVEGDELAPGRAD